MCQSTTKAFTCMRNVNQVLVISVFHYTFHLKRYQQITKSQRLLRACLIPIYLKKLCQRFLHKPYYGCSHLDRDCLYLVNRSY